MTLGDFFSSLIYGSFIELPYRFYQSSSIKAVISQTALVYLLVKVDYITLYPFNLIQGVFSHFALDIIDKKKPLELSRFF